MGFSRQGYWSGLPFPSPGDLPDPGIEPWSPTFQADALTSEPPGNSKWIKDLNVKPETIKLLEENIGRTLFIRNRGKILYDPPPKLVEIKGKWNKGDLIKLKSFCTLEENISKVKRKPSGWEKIIANKATDKELVSKIYKQLMQLNSRKNKRPNQ